MAAVIALILVVVGFSLLAGACEWIYQNIRIHKLTKEEKREAYLERTRYHNDGR